MILMQVWNKDKDPFQIIQSLSNLKATDVVMIIIFFTLSLHPVCTYLCVRAIYNNCIMETTSKH